MSFCEHFAIIYIFILMQNVVTGSKPEELDVSLDKENGTSSIYIGQSDILVVTVKVPDGVTEDLTVLFIASLSSTVFAIGNITEYAVGSDITSISNTTWFDDAILTPGPEYTDPNLKVYYNTMASFELGTITNNGSSNVEANSYITIKCEIVSVSLGNHSEGDSYLPSVAIAQANDSVVLVSREMYTLNGTNSSHAGSSSFELDSITTLEDSGKITNTDLTVNMTHATANLTVVSSVINKTGSVSPVKIEMVSVGEAYSYSTRQNKIIVTDFENCPVGKLTSPFLILDIGTIVNKESQKVNFDNSVNMLILRISWLVFESTALGKSFDLKVAVDLDGTEVYAETNMVTVITRSPPAAPLSVISAVSEGSSLVPAGASCSALVTMETPPGSLHTYVVNLVTRSKTGSDSKLMILSSTFDERDNNLPCPVEELSPFNATNTDSKNPHVTNEASMSFSVLNTGGLSGNQIKFKVKMLTMDDAINGSIYELVVNVSGIVRTVPYTIDDPIQLNVNFTAVHDGTNKVKIGGFGTARVTIHTMIETAIRYTVKLTTREKNSTDSKVSIVYSEFPPNVQTSPYMVDDHVNLSLTNGDQTNPSVQKEGNMSFSVINTGKYMTDDFEFIIKLVAHLDAINNTVYELVVDINDAIRIVEFTISDYNTLNTSFSVTHVGTDVIPAWGKGRAAIIIETIPESMQQFVVKLITREINGTESKLIILSYSFNSSQENSPAILEDNIMLMTYGADSVNTYVKNAGNMTFTVLNSGIKESNDTVLHIEMIALPDAVNNTVYELVVDVNGINKSVEFTVGDPLPFNTSVAYIFSMNINGDSSLAPGDEFDVIMNVTTTPNTYPGPMTIVLPEPSAASYVKFIEAKTESQGENVPCSQFGVFGYNLSSWDKTLQDNSKATVTIPFVCNIQTVNEDKENLWQINMRLQLTNHTDLQTSQQNIEFGVRVNFTDNPVYYQNLTVVSVPLPSPGQPGQIRGRDIPHSEDAITPWWWIAVGIAGLIVAVAIATAATVMIRKKRQMNKTMAVVMVAEYKDSGLPGKGIYCTD